MRHPINTLDYPYSTLGNAHISQFAPTLSEDDAVKQARLIKAFSEPLRLRILSILAQHEGDACVEDLVEALFPISQPTISHHIRILLSADIVYRRKCGLYGYYYIRRDMVDYVSAILQEVVQHE